MEQATAMAFISAQIQKRHEEKELLEIELAKEKIQSPLWKADEITLERIKIP